jgi:membrane protease YdiL (CAAX protease family)
MAEQKSQGLNIIVFLGLTVLLSCLFYVPILASGHLGAAAGRFYVAGLMWSPGIAALLTVWLRKLDISSLGLGWGRSGPRYALIGYLAPLAYALIAYVLIWVLGFGVFAQPATVAAMAKQFGWTVDSPAAFVPLYFIVMATTGMVGSVAHALGEEIGWRGFLTPRMVGRFGFTWGSLLIGLIWGAWHMPLFLFADYNNGTPWWFGMPCFFALTVGISFMMSWLRLRSGSVWPCAILHASHNLFIQGFFTPLTGAHGKFTPFAIDEFGLAVPAIGLLFALGFWLKRGKALEASAGDQALA